MELIFCIIFLVSLYYFRPITKHCKTFESSYTSEKKLITLEIGQNNR